MMTKRGQNTNYAAVKVGGAGYQLFEHYWKGRTYIRARVGKTYVNRTNGVLSVIPEFDEYNAGDVAKAVELAKEALAEIREQQSGSRPIVQAETTSSIASRSEPSSLEVFVAKGIPLARITPVKMAVSAEEYYASKRSNDD